MPHCWNKPTFNFICTIFVNSCFTLQVNQKVKYINSFTLPVRISDMLILFLKKNFQKSQYLSYSGNFFSITIGFLDGSVIEKELCILLQVNH